MDRVVCNLFLMVLEVRKSNIKMLASDKTSLCLPMIEHKKARVDNHMQDRDRDGKRGHKGRQTQAFIRHPPRDNKPTQEK